MKHASGMLSLFQIFEAFSTQTSKQGYWSLKQPMEVHYTELVTMQALMHGVWTFPFYLAKTNKRTDFSAFF